MTFQWPTLVFVALLTISSWGCSGAGAGSVGLPATDFDVFTLDGVARPGFITSMRGDVVLLNIWATWCGPCREEMPSLQRLHDAYAEDGLRVVAVSVDGPGAEPLVHRFVRDHELTLPVFISSLSRARARLSVSGIPTTLLIDRNGIIRGRYFARDWATPASRELVLRLLSEDPDAPGGRVS